MFKYSFKEIQKKEFNKTLNDRLYFINKLKKSHIPKTNLYWSIHKRQLADQRISLKGMRRAYDMLIEMPLSHKVLIYGKHYKTNKNEYIFSVNNVSDCKEIRRLFQYYYNTIRDYRNSQKMFQYNEHCNLMYKYVTSLSDVLPNENLKRIGKVRHTSGLFLKLFELNKAKKWFKYKAPLSKDNHVGVEIEGIINITTNKLAKFLHENHNELIDKVTIKSDGSIHGWEGSRNENPIELCILDEEIKIGETVKKVLEIIKKFGFKVNESCGLHVHLDMRNRDIKKSFANLYSFQSLMYKLTSYNRKTNKFTKPIKVANVDNYIDFRLYSRSLRGTGNARYKGINANALRDHKTIEIRIHAGSTDGDRIESWITFLTKIVNATDIPKKFSKSVKSITKLLNLDDKLVSYMKKFMKEEKDASKITRPGPAFNVNTGQFVYTYSTTSSAAINIDSLDSSFNSERNDNEEDISF